MDKEITLGEERAATAAARGGRRPHLGHVLGAAALLAPTLSITVPLTLAAMLGLTALAAMAIGLRDGRLRAMVRPGPFALVLGGFLAWAAASILWSIDPDFSAERLVRLAILMAAGCVTIAAARVMDDEERAAFGRLLTAGMAIGLAFLVFERVTDGWVHKTAGQHFDDHTQVLNAFNRGATVFALFVWPLMVVLWRRSARDAGLLLAAILALLVTLSSGAALAGVLLGAAALLIAYWRRRAVAGRRRGHRLHAGGAAAAQPPADAGGYQDRGPQPRIGARADPALGLSPAADLELHRRADAGAGPARPGVPHRARHQRRPDQPGFVRTGHAAASA
jgi:hypothetical protein